VDVIHGCASGPCQGELSGDSDSESLSGAIRPRHDGGMDRAALADFLRRRRDALDPADVGLDAGPRRRAPGLRREEVAHLTGMSVDYYVRMEQARSTQPSPQMLQALSRTLRLDADGRDHLFRLAGHPAPARTGTSSHVRPMLLRVMDDLRDSAAMVVSDLGVVLAQNRLSVLLLGPAPEGTGLEASTTWQWFTNPDARSRFPAEDHEQLGRVRVADLRATWAARSGAADVRQLVDALLAASNEFRRMWELHEVQVRRGERKRVLHPEVGLLDLECEVLTRPDDGQALVILSAPPGSPEIEKLRLVAVVGAQSLT
jgi:transcriptional regulator with XRE-family HTH domain